MDKGIEDHVIDKEIGAISFQYDLAKAVKDSKNLDWDSTSVYQVNKYITYTDNKKCMMFNYLCHHLSKFNQEKHVLTLEIDTPMNNLSDNKRNLSFTNIKTTNLSLTNSNIHLKKDRAKAHSNKIPNIINNWAHSNLKLNKIIDAQIPGRCEKILSGKIDEACNIYKLIDTKSKFSSVNDMNEDFKTSLISLSFINQSLIDKHCTTNPECILPFVTPSYTFPLQPLKCILNLPYLMESFTPYMRYLVSHQNVLLVAMKLSLCTLFTLMNLCVNQHHTSPPHPVILKNLLSP